MDLPLDELGLDFAVNVRRNRDEHDLGLRLVKHFLVVDKALARAVSLSSRLGALEYHVAKADYVDVVEARQLLEMRAVSSAAAYLRNS